MSTTGISDIPTEVLEMILDFLHDDVSALYASSLVARDWVSAPRYHIFNKAILSEIPEWRRRLPKDNAHSFLELVHSPHCTFQSTIQCIVLNITTQDLIKEIVDSLTHLKSLSQIVFMQHITSELISWNARSLPNIRDFTVNTLSTSFKDDVWELVASFPELHSLSVYTHSGPASHAIFILPPEDYGPRFCNLRTLRLRLVPSEAMLSWFQKFTGTQFPLATLDIRLYTSSHRGWGPVLELNSFLKSVSRTLKHLSVGIASYDYNNLVEDSVYESQHIDLNLLHNLQFLSLRIHDMGAVCDTLESLSSHAVLDGLAVTALAWPRLRLGDQHCGCVLPIYKQLERMAEILEKGQFSEIQSVDFGFAEISVLHLVRGIFTKIVQRGILQLIRADEYDEQVNTYHSLRPFMKYTYV